VECDLKSEQSGLIRDYGNLMKSLSISGMAKIAVIYGKAIGTGYAALAGKSIGYDYVLALSGSEISPVDASVAVNLMYVDEIKKAKDPVQARAELEAKYSGIQGDPVIAAKDGFIDNVIVPSALRPYVASALLMLLGI
jgi:acetyl-CoA carboxylase carboxyltransferase component